jgi:hypothetical protein
MTFIHYHLTSRPPILRPRSLRRRPTRPVPPAPILFGCPAVGDHMGINLTYATLGDCSACGRPVWVAEWMRREAGWSRGEVGWVCGVCAGKMMPGFGGREGG